MNNIAVIGCCGGIGEALIARLVSLYPKANITGFSRTKPGQPLDSVNYHQIDYENEASIEQAANLASSAVNSENNNGTLDLVIVTTGILHDETLKPEKSLRDLSADNFQRLFAANTITPALIAKYFLPKLNKTKPSIFAALSARVGSISDNRLGGWYAYRASKAALNMVIKNAAIEISRLNKQAIIVGLHPGTVNTNLSKPFQSNVAEHKLFTPQYCAEALLEVVAQLQPTQSGKCFAWDGTEVKP